MKTLELTQKFALVEYQIATLENYNPSIVIEADTLEELEALEISDYVDEGATVGCTIVEKTEEGLINVYSGELFEMKSYV
jgi:hypothetical protein